MKVKTIISAVIMSACVTSFASYANETKVLSLKQKPKNHIELLFFQQAHSGFIKMTSSGCYDLLLTDLDPNVIYFSNTPSKTAGNLSLTQFVETMTHSQLAEKVEPNALLNIRLLETEASSSVNLIGRLSNAYYTDKKFHYTFCSFDGNNLIKQGQIRSISLFIDPIHRWPP